MPFPEFPSPNFVFRTYNGLWTGLAALGTLRYQQITQEGPLRKYVPGGAVGLVKTLEKELDTVGRST